MSASVMEIPRGGRFRHVVFKGPGRPRPTNLTPRFDPVAPTPVTSPRCGRLTSDESAFIQKVFEHVGLDASAYRPGTLQRRLPACLRAVRATSIRQARQTLEKSPALHAGAVDAMLIGVTGFFRDAGVFEHLAREVLPALACRRGEIRVWSAGCSEGQELYSASMLLSEFDLLDRAYLLGTDCRAGAIAQSREGSYDPASVRDIPTEWAARYCPAEGTRHQIVPEIRERTVWRRASVTAFAEPGPWDLIFCRNVAMYLQPAIAGEVWLRLEHALRLGGYLVVGKAERPTGANRLAPHAPCIFRKVA